jgi:pre-mRNA-splicing factor SYF1
MLRIKRSVQAQYNTDVNFIASQAVARGQLNGDGAAVNGDSESADAMAALERQARAPQGFVAASTGPEGSQIKTLEQKQNTTQAPDLPTPAANPDAIDLDDDL